MHSQDGGGLVATRPERFRRCHEWHRPRRSRRGAAWQLDAPGFGPSKKTEQLIGDTEDPDGCAYFPLDEAGRLWLRGLLGGFDFEQLIEQRAVVHDRFA
jgi:hypothetical protein